MFLWDFNITLYVQINSFPKRTHIIVAKLEVT